MTNLEEQDRRILIAEDDPVSAHTLKSLLGKWNFDVTAVKDGMQALHILDGDDPPRLAVLDWMMPEIEGVQVCEQIRKRADRPYIYILLLTARTERRDLLRGLELGADDYLTKPFDSGELRARLHVGERILRLQDELRFRATHDSLTGIANRGAIIDALQNELSRQVRQQRPLGVILADIDHFKSINDTYGHLCGDAVLRTLAKRMKDCMRPYDGVGRYGGEEFLIVVSDSGAQGTMASAERIRRAIEAEPVSTSAGEIPVTASLGVAVNTDPEHVDVQALLQLADDALYQAKEHGRNRSELAASCDIPDSDVQAKSI
jgi:two-component system, cell cycle response regulator